MCCLGHAGDAVEWNGWVKSVLNDYKIGSLTHAFSVHGGRVWGFAMALHRICSILVRQL